MKNRSGTEIGLANVAVNAAVAAFFGTFAYAHGLAFAVRPRTSVAIMFAVELTIAVMFILRSPSSRTSTSLWDWATAVAGTLLPLLLRPVAGATDVVVAQVLQSLGGACAIAAVFALNRSIGAVPADRGVKSGGMYRFVRHPLYAAYTLTNLGYLLSNISAANVLVVLCATALQVIRIFNEERLLSESADYREYQLRTRWRLIPGLF